MKPIPYRTDPDNGRPDLFTHCKRYAIDRHTATRENHAIHATTAYERAVIFLRLLLGEAEWSDGYERKVDDCFEMNDGDAVCGWLLEFADHAPRIQGLLWNHASCSGSTRTLWESRYRNAHHAGELALS